MLRERPEDYPLLVLVPGLVVLILLSPLHPPLLRAASACLAGVAAFGAARAADRLPARCALFAVTLLLILLSPAPLPPHSPALLSVPLFALSGELAVAGGIGDRILGLAALAAGHGAKAAGSRTALGCALFATVSGVGATTVEAGAKRLLPQLLRAGYSPPAAAAALACASAPTVVIPTSVPITVYAAAAGIVTNVIAAACFLPGILMALMIFAALRFLPRGRAPEGGRRLDPPKRRLAVLWKAKWAVLLPVVVLGGIFTGAFTVPEASAFACAYCFVIGVFAHGTLRLRDAGEIIPRAASGSGVILLLAGAGSLVAATLAEAGISERAAEFVLLAAGRSGAIILMNCILLAAGCFLRMPSVATLVAPLLLPLATKCGMHPVHFGVVVVMSIAIGLVTPPQAANIASAARAAGASERETARAALPFFAAMALCLLAVSFLPELSLPLPEFFGWPL